MTNWKATQNSDGGWAYNLRPQNLRTATSATEPTALALLAQSAVAQSSLGQSSLGQSSLVQSYADADPACFEAGLAFLRKTQRVDGGWGPQPAVEESTWVTALVALLGPKALGQTPMARALEWLKGQTGRESSFSFRLQSWLSGERKEYPKGWPWFPGAAAWVIPTSMGLLSFSSMLRNFPDAGLEARVHDARNYLFQRMCSDGGWNHGSNEALGVDGDSYPETTGVALLALRGASSPALQKALAAARKHLATCRTAEGISWLRMGLAAHGEMHQATVAAVPRTLADVALLELADAPRNPLLS